MKKILSIVVLFALMSAGAFAQAVIKYDKSAVDFGKFSEKKVMTAEFTFTNTGDEPLVIQQAMTTCGCTVADYTKEKIMPGQKGKLKVSYNGKGKPKGHFKKVITVRSNASNALTRVYISGIMTVENEK